MEEAKRHNFTDEQKKRIMGTYYCMREAYFETIRKYVEQGKATIEKDRFGRLTCVILPEKA